MKSEKLYIDEENTHILWGLVAVVSIGMASYILINAFMAGSWEIAGSTQLLSLALFSIGFYGIIRISSPLFHFILFVEENMLHIETWKEGEKPVHVKTLALDNIEALRIAPHTPRSAGEALYDFSTSYHLLYKERESGQYKRLIDPEGESFTLRVEDIRKVIRFLRSHGESIDIPEEESLFLNY